MSFEEYMPLYIDEVTDTQGSLFAQAARMGYRIDRFAEDFMRSELRRQIDDVSPIYCTMTPEIMMEYLKKEGVVFVKADEVFDEIQAEWLGVFYSRIQFKSGEYSKDLIKRYPSDMILSRYNALHDLDVDLAVEKLLKVS